MRIFLVLLLLTCASRGHGEDLPLYGPLPKLTSDWLVREKGGLGDPPWRWSWVILTNSQNGDLLSFAAHKGTSEKPRELIKWSDTAHELFPGGLPRWTVKSGFGTRPIRNSVVKINLVNAAKKEDLSRDALEYTFIQEDGSNRLAHGYALDFEGLVVFVQHTSMRAITPDLAHDMAVSLISNYAKEKSGTPSESRVQPVQP
jgi:hypothetical protein